MPLRLPAWSLSTAPIFQLAGIIAALFSSGGAHAADPKVPDGFRIEKIAGAPLISRPIFACLDEQGNLYVGESSGENLKRDDMLAKKPHWITKLIDKDGDGVYDESVRFVEGITLPQGCLWYRGSLYVTCPPGIWKFTDTDGDGKADQREEILTGFGFSGNACDTHGPFLSPSGRLYIVQGRHGHVFRDKNGEIYSQGKAGRIYSCMPDGSDVRVHGGGGFDNPVEVDYTDTGDCLGTVNIVYRDRGDCLVHWVEGSVFPREDQADAIAEFPWTGGLLNPVYNLGHVAVSGLARYRGQQFGSEFANSWFHAEFNTHKVRYVNLKQSGSTWAGEVKDFLHCDDGDYHPTDVLEDVDGSLLVLNTGGWFLLGCPTSRIAKPEIYGTVHRITKVDGPTPADPRGARLTDWTSLSDPGPTFLKHLNDPRPFVREQTVQTLRFQPELFDRVQGLLTSPHKIADGSSKLTLHQYAGLLRATTERKDAVKIATAQLQQLPGWKSLTDDRLEAAADVAQAALLHARDLVWERPLSAEASTTLLASLKDAPVRVFRAGMEFTATPCTDRKTSVLQAPDDVLTNFIAAASPQLQDRFAEHAFIFAMQRWNRPAPLVANLTSDARGVPRAALIALSQIPNSPLKQEMVLPLLSANNSVLQETALEVISRHVGWEKETLQVLKGWAKEPEISSDRLVALNSFLASRLQNPEVQQAVIDLLNDDSISATLRKSLWATLQKSTLPKLPEKLVPLVTAALQSQDPALKTVSLQLISRYALKGFEKQLVNISSDASQDLTARCEAVIALGATGVPLQDSVYQELVTRLQSASASSDEKTLIGRALGSSHLTPDQFLGLANSFDAAGPLVVPTLLKAFQRTTDPQVGKSLVDALLQTDAVVSVSPDELASILRKYPDSVKQASQPLFKKLGLDVAAQEARLAELAPLLTGGDPQAGRDVFFGPKAACSSCHAIGPQGARVGPHLTTIGASRSSHDLLEAIVFPSASFVNGYRSTLIVTSAGKVIQGVISAETSNTVTLRTQDLQEIIINREDIEEQRESSTSIMPAGLDRQLTPKELRDLIAFLQSRK